MASNEDGWVQIPIKTGNADEGGSWEQVPLDEVAPKRAQASPMVAPVDSNAAKAAPSVISAPAPQAPPEPVNHYAALMPVLANQPPAPVPEEKVPEFGGTPTLSQGDGVPLKTNAEIEASHKRANLDVGINIPGTDTPSNLTPGHVLSALNAGSLGTAPYIQAAKETALQSGIDILSGKTPVSPIKTFDVKLNDWHSLVQQASQENPTAGLIGGLAPLPLAPVTMVGRLALGGGAMAIAGFLQTDPRALLSDKLGNAAVSGAQGLAFMGALHVAGSAFKGAVPPLIQVISPEVSQDIARSFNLTPEPALASGPVPKKTILPSTDRATFWKELGEKPQELPTHKVTDARDLNNPTIATLREMNDGKIVGVIYDEKGQSTGHYYQELSTPAQARKFMGAVQESGVGNFAPLAEHWEKLPEQIQDALTTPRNKRGDFITPADEAPQGMPDGSALVEYSPDGKALKFHALDSDAARIASLRARDIMAVDTPKGVRFIHSGYIDKASTKTSHLIGLPFEPEEGIPTISRVSRIGYDNIRAATDAELEKVVSQHKEVAYDMSNGRELPSQKAIDIHEHPTEARPDYLDPIEAAGPDTQADIARSNTRPPAPPRGPEEMPPTPPPGPPPPPEAEASSVMGELAKKASLYDRTKRQLIGAHLRAPLDLANYISDQQSLRNLEKAWVGTTSALENTLGKKGTTDFRAEVLKVFEGPVDGPAWKAMEAKAETDPGAKQAWTSIREMVGSAIRKRDANQKWLTDRGYVPNDTFSQNEGDLFTAYATREYAAHNLPPGEWAKIITKDNRVMQNAVDGYKRWNKGNISDIEAKAKILEALSAEDPYVAMFEKKTTSQGLAPQQKLRFRKDLPDWYRELLGENRDGFLAIGKTLATQDALISNFKIWEGMASHPEWVAPAPATKEWRQLPNNSRAYGKAAGMWMEPAAYDALVTLPNIKYEGDKWILALNSYVKTNQVSLGSFRTFLNMFMDNTMGGVLAGGVDPTRPIATAKALKFAAKSMYEHYRNPLAEDSEFVTFIKDARRIGIDAPGHVGTDTKAINKRQAADAMLAISKIEDDYSSIWTKIAEMHSKVGAAGSSLVDGIDRVHKLASWKMLIDEKIASGSDPETAMRSSARPIFQSYAMYDRLAPLAERMRSGLVGVAAPYSTFAMERNRIYGMLPGRLLSNEDPALKFRLLRLALFGTAVYGVNGMRRFGNVSQEDVDYVMQKRKGSSQEQFSPPQGVWVAPVRDGQGRPAVLDMTQWWGPLSYLQGDQSMVTGAGEEWSPILNGIANAGLNAVRAPLQGGAAGEAADFLQKQAGINVGFQSQTPPPGGSKLASFGDALLRSGLVPRGPMDAYENVRKTGALGDTGSKEPLTGLQALLRTAPGLPFEAQPTEASKRQAFVRGIGNARAILTRAATMKPDRGLPVLQETYEWLMKIAGQDHEAKRMATEAHNMIKNLTQENHKLALSKRASEISGGNKQ